MIVASRVDPVQIKAPVILSGTLRRDAEAGWKVGAVPVLLKSDAGLQDGSFAIAEGFRHGRALSVTLLRTRRFTGAAGALTALSVEGFLSPEAKAPFYAVDGLGHSFAEDAQVEAYVGQRTLFTGGYDGAFRVREGLILQQAFDARRQQLRV